MSTLSSPSSPPSVSTTITSSSSSLSGATDSGPAVIANHNHLHQENQGAEQQSIKSSSAENNGQITMNGSIVRQAESNNTSPSSTTLINSDDNHTDTDHNINSSQVAAGCNSLNHLHAMDTRSQSATGSEQPSVNVSSSVVGAASGTLSTDSNMVSGNNHLIMTQNDIDSNHHNHRMGTNHRAASESSSTGSTAGGGRDPDPDAIKMFVGQIPRDWTEAECRQLFSEFGEISSLNVLRDKQTGLSRGCCFVTFVARKSALGAQDALHNIRTLAGMHHPIQMKPADSENRNERKLFIGMLAKKYSENDVRLMFAAYGNIEECTVLRDAAGVSKGCAFVTFATRQCAVNAIKHMNHSQTMDGCSSPLVVKFADTQKDKDARRQQQIIMQQLAAATVAQGSVPSPQSTAAAVSATLAANPYLALAATVAAANAQAASQSLQQSQQQPQQQQQQQQQLAATALAIQQLTANHDPLAMAALLASNPLMLATLCAGNPAAAPGSNGATTPQSTSSSHHTLNGSASDHHMYGNHGSGVGNGHQHNPHTHQSPLHSAQSFHHHSAPAAQNLAGTSPAHGSLNHFGSAQAAVLAQLAAVTGHGASGNHHPHHHLTNGGVANHHALHHHLTGGSHPLTASGLNHLQASQQAQQQPKQLEGPDGANLFIYHLPAEFGDPDLAQAFSPFGNVLSSKVFIDKQTNLSKCFGFVSYDNQLSAQAAIQSMNGFQIGTKRLKVQLKRSKDKPY